MKRLSVTMGLLLCAVVSGATLAQAHTSSAVKKTPTPTRPAPPPSGAPGLMGTVRSISGNTLTITLQSRKTATIKLTAKTSYTVNGKPVSKRPTLKKGSQVQIRATRQKNGTYVAQAVMVGTPGAPPQSGNVPPGGTAPPPGGTQINGTVVSISHNVLVIKSGKTTKRLRLTAKTQYMVNGKPQSKRPTFKRGQTVHVTASKSGKTLVAQMVGIGSMPSGPPPGGGPPPTA